MKKVLKEKVDAMAAFVKFCKENSIVWQDIPAFAAMLDALEVKMESIDSTEEAQEANKKGVTLTKRQKKIAMAGRADAVALTGQAYARSIGDNDLYSMLSTSYSDILGAKDQESLTEARRVYNLVKDLPAGEVAKFGITEAVLDTLKDAIEVFADVRPSTRNVKTRRETLTKNCTTLVDEGNDIMRKDLLKIGRQFKATNPDFYSGLVANAKVISSHEHSKLRLTVVASEQQQPLTGVLVDIDGTTLKGVTDMKGKCTVTRVPAGLHSVTLLKTGYEKTVIDGVEFKKGKSTTLQAEMAGEQAVVGKAAKEKVMAR